MVCYYYPPLADVGTKRSVAFSKYFKKYGWHPYVLSVKNPDKTYCLVDNVKPPSNITVDYTYSLLNTNRLLGVINGVVARFMKLFARDLKRNYLIDIFCIPDIFSGWIPLTVLRGVRAIKENHMDIIYVSCSPFSAAVIGVILKIITRKPLIIDFRDVYALEIPSLESAPTKPVFRKKIDAWIEDIILKWADLFVVTTEEMRDAYLAAYDHLAAKIFTVHNGFETGDLPIKTPLHKFTKFTIVYAGNFYFDAFGSDVFFQALALLKDKGRIHGKNFQFLYYGGEVERFHRMSRRLPIEDLVVTNPHMSHDKLMGVLRRSHLELIRIMKPMISTKVFEGIAMNIPLLAIIPNGEVEQMIKKYSPSAYVITELSPGKVAAAILDAMNKYEKNDIRDNHVSEFLKRFSREHLTLNFMKIIETNIHDGENSKTFN